MFGGVEMAKRLFVTCVLLFLPVGPPQKNTFAKYKAVEAYEVQPGLLMFPRYAEDGQVCEIGIERRHYSPEKIVLYSTLSRNEMDAIVNDLAPPNERGPGPGGPFNGLVAVMGHGKTATEEYQNVFVRIHSVLYDAPDKQLITDDVVMTIEWKNRKCQ
jgi:hypothetical protein